MQHLELLRGGSAREADPHPMALDGFTDPKGRRRQGWHRGRSYRHQVLRGNTLHPLISPRLQSGGWWPNREEDESLQSSEFLDLTCRRAGLGAFIMLAIKCHQRGQRSRLD